MRPPIIGVTSNVETSAEPEPPQQLTSLRQAYTDAVYAAGGVPLPIPIPPEGGAGQIDRLLAALDGLVLSGGFDLHPRHYGQPVHPEATLLDPRREAFELELTRRADALGLPILAICLGFQVTHVIRGGKLVQHVDDLGLSPALKHHLPRERSAFHPVRISAGTRLAEIVGRERIEVNSRHHQVVDIRHQGRDLRPTAYAPDGILEASEQAGERFLVAVQWHPEDLIERREHLCLFEAVVRAAAEWSRAKRDL